MANRTSTDAPGREEVPDATQRFLHETEELAAGAGRLFVLAFGLCRGDEPGELATRGGRKLRREFIDRDLVIDDQPVAPALRAPEPGCIGPRELRFRLERGANRLAVDAAHQLADELALAQERGPARDAARERDRIRELVGEVQAFDEAVGRRDQAIGQVLDGHGLALQFTFGGRRDSAGQLAAAHRQMLARAPLPTVARPVQSAVPCPKPPNRTRPRSNVSSSGRSRSRGRAGRPPPRPAVGVSTGLSVTVRLGEVETLEYQRDRSLGVTVYAGQRKGSASTANLTPAAVEETIAKALSIASFTADDAYAGLPDAGLMADNLPDLDLSHPWDLEAPEAIELARRCEAASLAHDKRISNSEGASISTHRKLRVFGNSHGFVGGYPSTSHSVSCVVLGQHEGAMQRDYWYTAARDWRGLEDVEEVGAGRPRRRCSGSAPANCRRASPRCCSRLNSRAA